MALIVITLVDTPSGDTDVGVVCEPAIPTDMEGASLTGAQAIAINMLKNATDHADMKEDRGLEALVGTQDGETPPPLNLAEPDPEPAAT